MDAGKQYFSVQPSQRHDRGSAPQDIDRLNYVLHLGDEKDLGDQKDGSPFEMLVQGKEQTIHIPLEKMLVEVMKRMPAKEAARFKCTQIVSGGYQVTVDLNVTGSRATVDHGVRVATIVGDVASTQEMAMLSAVNKAFEYLENKHFVQVRDYSSKVGDGYECSSHFRTVNSILYNVEKVLGDWLVVIEKIGNFHADLESKETYETRRGVMSAAGVIYADAKEFVNSVFSTFRDKHRAVYLEFQDYEGRRAKYVKQSHDKVRKYSMKGYRQFPEFDEKQVLSCVLDLLGLKPAQFSNKVVGSHEFCGEVIINLPEIEYAGCGGTTRFEGGFRSSATEAESDAAYKALRFMEANLKLTIVDFNYPERVEAKAKHDIMAKLLRSILFLARSVLDDWSKMVESINDGGYIYEGNPMTSSAAEVAAMKFLKEEFAKLEVVCKNGYEEALTKLKWIEQYKPCAEYYEK